MQRHGRQTKLAEVGAAGQARIARARVDVAVPGLAGEVAVRYLAGAGIGQLRVCTEPLAAIARAVDSTVAVEVTAIVDREKDGIVAQMALRDPAAQALAEGAHLALSALREALAGAS